MRGFLLLCAVLAGSALHAQERPLAQFAVWKPKAGLEKNFEAGYRQHLLWHKANGDTWGWYGWFITSGPRAGTFVDATFDHSWQDFNMPVNPAGDRADNELHVYPAGDFLTVFKAARVAAYSTGSSRDLQSRLIRMLTLSVQDITAALKIVGQVKAQYTGVQSFQTFQVLDGGEANRLILLLGFNNWEAYGQTENLPAHLLAAARTGGTALITGITSETMVYRPDMSLFPGQ